MFKLLFTAGLVGALSLIAVSSASAVSGPAMVRTNGTPGIASNTGAVSGNASSYGAHVFTANGSVQVRCNDAGFDVISTATQHVTATPTYAGCALFVAGTSVGTATIDTCHLDQTYTHAIFTPTAGTDDVTFTTTCSTTVTIPSLPCNLHFPAQTRAGITLQNIDAAGSNSTAATPWGSKLITAASGLEFTSVGSCAGFPASGTGSYTGTVAIRNLFGSL